MLDGGDLLRGEEVSRAFPPGDDIAGPRDQKVVEIPLDRPAEWVGLGALLERLREARGGVRVLRSQHPAPQDH